MVSPVILWFRRDLRLADNPALMAAANRPIVPLFVLDDDVEAGGASRWWLHHSLEALGKALAARGLTLVRRRGDPARVLSEVVAQSQAGAVYWNRGYEPSAVARDTAIKAALARRGIETRSFNASLLFEPGRILTRGGEPFKVFTPFWRACLAQPEPPAPQAVPERLHAAPGALTSDELDSWGLRPQRPDWAGGLRETWRPGEAGAAARLADFLPKLGAYADGRDIPGQAATSRLSPHLHLGEIGPRQVWHAVRAAGGMSRGVERFLTELGWREFSQHLLFQCPHLPTRSLRPEFEAFPWSRTPDGLRAWQKGATGYPIVDAGMRELWRTGWMHNRVRMIAASFLVKHLLVPWQDGAAWFQDTLVDADLANNSAGWQWVAGCGTDAAPYFRIFNPVLQGEKFDAAGGYVRRWVPELSRLPDRWLHRPWDAPDDVLAAAGVVLGKTYPRPIVDHGAARRRALDAFASLRDAA